MEAQNTPIMMRTTPNRPIFGYLKLCLFAFFLSFFLKNETLAQCQTPPNLSPEQVKKLEWASFLDTAALQVIRRLNGIRNNPISYAQSTILPNIRNKKEIYSDPEVVENMTRTNKNYEIDGCEKKLYKTHTLKGQDVANQNTKEAIELLNLANNTKPQPPIQPCQELTTSTDAYGKYFIEMLADGFDYNEIADYERCMGKAPIPRDWGAMPVVQYRTYQSKEEPIKDFVDRLIDNTSMFKDLIASPFCTIGASRFLDAEKKGYIWFIYFSNTPGSPEYVARSNKKI